MILFPNAKINLGLRVTGKRADGYHNIESFFFPIPLYDSLEFLNEKLVLRDFQKQFDERETGAVYDLDITDDLHIRMKISGNKVEGEPMSNLCIKAVRIFNERVKIKGSFLLHLLKNIPSGAGLGGGSADGSAMLKLLNDYAGASLSEDELKKMAAELGSDCVPLLINKPGTGTGRGELFEVQELSLKGYTLVIVKPDIHISTAEAFDGIIVSDNYRAGSLREHLNKPPESWNGKVVNDFEASLFPKYPLLAQIRQVLYDSGADYASLTGSGSALYGIFKHKPLLEKFPERTFTFVTEL